MSRFISKSLLENILENNTTINEDEILHQKLNSLKDYQDKKAKELSDHLHTIMTNIGNSMHSNDGSYQKHREELDRHLKRIARHHDEMHSGITDAHQDKLKREGKW